MVTFTNIIFDDEWIYADAYDHDNKISSKVRIHRRQSIMVTFTNIIFDDEWIYADAYDHDNKISSKVRIHRTKSNVIELDCRDSVQIIKAAWALKRYVNKARWKSYSSMGVNHSKMHTKWQIENMITEGQVMDITGH